MSVLLFFHKSIRIYMEVIILGANTLYSVFCFFKALLPKQVWSGMVGKGLMEQVYLSQSRGKDILVWHPLVALTLQQSYTRD